MAAHQSGPEPDVAALVERLRRIEAQHDIIDVVSRYSHSIDYGDAAGWIDCFTDDATWELVACNETVRATLTSRQLIGRDELEGFIATHSSAPARWHKHCVVEPIVRVDGDSATCHSYFFTLNDHTTGAHVRVFGRYIDLLRRQSDDAWRIASRRCEVEQYHPLAIGDPFTTVAEPGQQSGPSQPQRNSGGITR